MKGEGGRLNRSSTRPITGKLVEQIVQISAWFLQDFKEDLKGDLLIHGIDRVGVTLNRSLSACWFLEFRRYYWNQRSQTYKTTSLVIDCWHATSIKHWMYLFCSKHSPIIATTVAWHSIEPLVALHPLPVARLSKNWILSRSCMYIVHYQHLRKGCLWTSLYYRLTWTNVFKMVSFFN